MHIHKNVLFLLVAITSLFAISCKKEDTYTTESAIPFEVTEQVAPDTHRWFYFTRNGFTESALPQESPDYPFRPWTQAPRVSGTLSGSTEGYLLVNRRGLVLLSANEEPRLLPDTRLFTGTTADTLLTSDGNPIFKLYINTLFEEQVDVSATARGIIPVVVQYNPATSLYYPLITKSDLGLTEDSQVTAMVSDGSNWYFSGKETTDNQTTFTYVSRSTESAVVSEISELEFRALWDQKPFTAAPGRYRELLSAIPNTIPFMLTTSDYSQSSRGMTPTVYYNGLERPEDDVEMLSAYGQTSQTWTAVLFSDGTCYFTGSLPGLHILNNGRPVYFHLPSLPEDMEYTDFAICGKKLYAGWEETQFYNTGKAGFLEVNLERVLY